MAVVGILILLCAVLAAGQAPESAVITPQEEKLFTFSEPQAPAPAPASGERNGSCGFVSNRARYYQVEAEATLQGSINDTLVNDALIRLMRSQLLVAPCQLVISEGEPCTSGTLSLPCADPVFQCGDGVVISEDVYNAALKGSCTGPANNTLVCGVIAANPQIPTIVASGVCKPTCISGGGLQEPQNMPTSCISFQITIDAPTLEQAQELAVALAAPGLATTIATGLGGFGAADMQFLIVDSQVVTAVGYGSFPPPPSPPPPLRVISPADDGVPDNTTAATLAAAGVLAYGPWTNCTPVCGPGFRTRTASCFAPDGTLLPLQECPGGTQAKTFESCSEPCPDAYWTYSTWSTCSVPCGGGISTRLAACTSPIGAQCPATENPTSTSCNTAACESFSWQVSSWGECDAPCGGGNRTRSVECLDASGAPTNATSCATRKPPSKEICNIQACDFCADNPCLGRGTCINGACLCDNEFTGPKCEIPSSCGSGIIDANLACCSSGLVNLRGECCPAGSVLDADGECCSKAIDVCGQCGGNGLFIDMQGTCCTVADANGVCCTSEMVDECGVCDGVGNTCDVLLEATVDVPATLVMGTGVQDVPIEGYFQDIAASMGIPPESVSVGQISMTPTPPPAGRRRLAQDQAAPSVVPTVPLVVDVKVTPSNSTASTTPFSSAYLSAGFTAVAANGTDSTSGISLVGTPLPGRAAVCGNKVCEIGERSTLGAQDGTCPGDCGLPAIACIGGCGIGGNCLPASGVCQCYLGYLGPNCVECRQGYIMSGGVCVTSVTAWGLINSTVVNAQGEALVGGDSGGANIGLIVGATIGGIAALALIITAIMCVRSRRSGSSSSAYNSKVDDPYSQFQFGTGGDGGGYGGNVTTNEVFSAEDEEMGLRRKYGVSGPQVGPGSARSYQVHVAAGPAAGGGGGDEGWYSARDRPSQSMQQDGSGPMGDFVRHSTRSLPAQAELQGSFRTFDGWGGAGAHPTSARDNKGEYALRSSRTGSHSARSGSIAPRPPSARDDVRGSRQSLGATMSSDAASGSGAGSHSAAMSLQEGNYGGGGGNDDLRASSSMIDPGGRLFFNPAYSMEVAGPRASVAPGYAAPLSARPASGDVQRMQVQRPLSARSGVGSPEEVEDRRAKLQALRAAVKALEQQRGAAAGQIVEPEAAPVVEKKAPAGFLPGRPAVPRLALGSIGAPNPPRPARAAAAKTSAPAPKQQQQQQQRQQQQIPLPPSDTGLIKAHPGPTGAPSSPEIQHRPSPGANFARGAKTFFRSIATSLTPSPGASGDKKASRAPKVPIVYDDVMAAVDGALQRSAGNSPAKKNSARGGGGGSARGDGSARAQAVGAGGSKQAWRS